MTAVAETDVSTWQVTVTVTSEEDTVTARADLRGGPIGLCGQGVAHVDGAPREDASVRAVMRSLANLTDALGYVASSRRFATLDQA